VIGFIVTIIVTAIGLVLSPVVKTLPPNTTNIQVPILFEILRTTLVKSPVGGGYLLFHPIAFAGWVGMVVTMLNLLPTGMLDGGHTVRSLLGDKARWVLTFLSFAVLLYFGYWLMLFLVLFLSAFRHPGPLDDVSKLSTSRKISSLLLVAVFVLSIAPLATL
jgi:membrane-associated protease RseP (regulator of RpoE activity)